VNLQTVRDEIKAVVEAAEGTPTQKFVTLLLAIGITDPNEIADIMGVGVQTVEEARQ
jgi:DNA-binding CsgD family transcriptional regulator